MLLLTLVLAATLGSTVSAQSGGTPVALTPQQRAEDFSAMCRFVQREYAYLEQRATDWQRVCESDAPLAEQTESRTAFIAVLERSLSELHDHHAHLNTANADSPRLVPTGSMLRARWRDGQARITDVREGSAAAAAVKPGDVIVAIQGVPTAQAIALHMPRHLRRSDPAAEEWALHVALAGPRDRPVNLRLRDARGRERDLQLEAPRLDEPRPPMTLHMQAGAAQLRIHNSLGDEALIKAFDEALAGLPRHVGVVLDLRDTPSGGNSTVARALMGHFVGRAMPYQRHDAIGEFRQTGVRRIWTECVAPRAQRQHGRLVVLVGGWTGSMGEGIAIGLHAAAGATVVGRPMAGLLGALGSIDLPHSRITVRIPTEKLHHVDGRRRENFMPEALKLPSRGAASKDPVLDAAFRQLRVGTRPRDGTSASRSVADRLCATHPAR